jgi:hypothetical protein
MVWRVPLPCLSGSGIVALGLNLADSLEKDMLNLGIAACTKSLAAV